MKKILIGICIILLLSGCSARTPEGSCMNACTTSYDCYYYGENIQANEESNLCEQRCFEKCYNKILNNNS